MSRDPRQRLKDAVAAGREAVAMIEGVDAERFAARSVVVRGVERCIFIIGEALTHVDEGVREAHREIPWREIIGMRNLLAHGYFRVDPMVLWTTVSRDLPELIVAPEKIVGNA